ncbi:MAG: hypothetical protein ACYCVZ_03190 [Streptosporangiaceae bacterium]
MPATAPATAPGSQSSGPSRSRCLRTPWLPAHTLIVVWYARHGYDQADIDARRDDQPWYGEKTEPAFEYMLVKLRRVMIAARFSAATPGQPADHEIRAVTSAWAAAAA